MRREREHQFLSFLRSPAGCGSPGAPAPDGSGPKMRKSSNYEGVDEYGSDAEDANAERFHRGMLHIADVGLLHYEIMLVQYVGLEAYEEELLAWIRSAAKIDSWATEAVERRLEAAKLADETLFASK